VAERDFSYFVLPINFRRIRNFVEHRDLTKSKSPREEILPRLVRAGEFSIQSWDFGFGKMLGILAEATEFPVKSLLYTFPVTGKHFYLRF